MLRLHHLPSPSYPYSALPSLMVLALIYINEALFPCTRIHFWCISVCASHHLSTLCTPAPRSCNYSNLAPDLCCKFPDVSTSSIKVLLTIFILNWLNVLCTRVVHVSSLLRPHCQTAARLSLHWN